MIRWKSWWQKAVAMILDPAMHVCTVCGQKVTHATMCASCGVAACPECRHDELCPYCGEPAQ